MTFRLPGRASWPLPALLLAAAGWPMACGTPPKAKVVERAGAVASPTAPAGAAGIGTGADSKPTGGGAASNGASTGGTGGTGGTGSQGNTGNTGNGGGTEAQIGDGGRVFATTTPTPPKVLTVLPVWESSSRLVFAEILADGSKRLQSPAVDVPPAIAAAKHRVAFGDFDGDRRLDALLITQPPTIILRKETGPEPWTLSAGAPWIVEGVGDIDANGLTDLLWRNQQTFQIVAWTFAPNKTTASAAFPAVGYEWSMIGLGDFDGDRKDDIFWRNRTSQQVVWWKLDGLAAPVGAAIGQNLSVPFDWSVQEIGDFDGDGKDDLLWVNETAGTEKPLAFWGAFSGTEGKFLSFPLKGVRPLTARAWPKPSAAKGIAPATVDGAPRVLGFNGTEFVVEQFIDVVADTILAVGWTGSVALSFGGMEAHDKAQRAIPLPPP